MSEEFDQLFLNKDALKTFFIYMCKMNMESADPILDTLTTILTQPITFCVNKYGLILFKQSTPIPFSILQPAQRQLIFQMCSSLHSEVHTFGAFLRITNPLTYVVENERITFNVVVPKIDPRIVILMLIECLQTNATNYTLLFNLILQRLSSRVHLNRELIEFAHLTATLLDPKKSADCNNGDQQETLNNCETSG
jgi:hypothetical protein